MNCEIDKSEKLIKLKGVFLTLTNKCNLKCKYCYQDSSPSVDTSKELKKQDWIKIIDKLKSMNVKKVSIVGGEPFIFPKFWELLEYLYKKEFKVKIFTNAHFLNKSGIDILKKYKFSLSFNLNSSIPEIQDFYQEKGSWMKTINAIKLCKEKVSFEIASPLTKRNYPDIKNFVKLCESLGAKRLRLVPLIPKNKDLDLEKVSKKEIQELDKKLKNIKGIEVTVGCRICEGGIYYITIQPDGNITPCTVNKQIIGKVQKGFFNNF